MLELSNEDNAILVSKLYLYLLVGSWLSLG